MSGERQANTVDRALAVLAILGSGEATFAQLSHKTGCPSPTLSRLLKGLIAADLVVGGNGVPYRSTQLARDYGSRMAGTDNYIARIRRELADLSQKTETGCGWFRLEAEGVRCLVRHVIPEGVGIMAEDAVRTDLRGHGCAVAGCALLETAEEWHATQLKEQLGYDERAWQERLNGIRHAGYDLSYAMEGTPGSRLRIIDTLARLSVPHLGDDGCVYILAATGHGLGAERVFPQQSITAAQASAAKICNLWNTQQKYKAHTDA